ncbi:MAG TPA: response regulator [Gemmatimonadaceae bacterium]|nr:response regulator [Gemmatimonadaceae bacterium]
MSEGSGGRPGAIAHELNNLLAAIQGNADLMRGDFGGVEAIREGLDEIDRAVARARDLTRKLQTEVALEARDSGERPSTAPPRLEVRRESRGQTVLIADDEEPVRRVASRLLARNGYDVLEAADGTEALRMLAAGKGAIDLLVSDIIMPEMGGLELARRAAIEFPSLPVLLISGYSDSQELGQSIPPDLDLLQKPFSGTELTAAVARCLARGKSGKPSQ